MAAAVTNQFECLTCSGIYFDRCNDGAIYNHVCGFKPGGPAFTVIPYDNPRNENPAVSRSGFITGIVSEGSGVKCLTNQNLTEPPWITLLKSRIAEQGD